MAPNSFNSKDFGQLAAYSQVGLEMVGPIVLGLVIDHYWHTDPWGVVIGAVFGFVGGLAHLVHLANQPDPPKSPPGSEVS
jgi:F0F1-type ATP synthase assembly protein I